jgi:hypothetical protein
MPQQPRNTFGALFMAVSTPASSDSQSIVGYCNADVVYKIRTHLQQSLIGSANVAVIT